MSEIEDHRQAIVLLRGINVGKAKRIAMADLRQLFSELGYSDVQTVLNSGNVVFGIPAQHAFPTASEIEAAISSSCGVGAPVVILSADEFRVANADNPLTTIATDPSRLLVAFLGDSGDMGLLQPLLAEQWAPEAIALGERVAYLWCPEGVLKSRLPAAVGNALGDAVTIRNWATVGKIHRLLE